ncbi:RNA polymerase sigma factor sigC [Typha angustifolia]|uniref:RNA polymerase sigma factor sigC n=1 Tax=Typha angustifolia TaxID=59011 RepID=UPI003C2CE4A8
MGFRFMAVSRNWASPIPSPCCTRLNYQLFHQASLSRSRAIPFESGRILPIHIFLEGSDSQIGDSLKVFACSFGQLQHTEDISGDAKDMKVNVDRMPLNDMHDMFESLNMMDENLSAYSTSLSASNSLQFNLLMENLNKIEDILDGKDLVRLQRDILVHIRQLGALKLFHAYLSRTVTVPTVLESDFLLTEHFANCHLEFPVNEQKADVIVRTGKNEERKLRRQRASEKATRLSYLTVSSKKLKAEKSTFSSPISVDEKAGLSALRSRRSALARNESEMSEGVKEVVNLERTRRELEKEIGRPPSYARWAEAAGIDQETLQQRLQFGWYCRDKLIKSTRSLVMYLAKNYRGMGIAFDDLLQAGKVGVLNGAERFDNKKGYKFSTYVQYWIRKSILALVARHSRGIHIPVRMDNMINRIQKARRALRSREGRYPQDEEIAKFTGLSLANVRLARKCSRPVGSIDQDIGSEWCTKFMEITPDTTVESSDDVVMKQHMRENLLKLLEELQPRERQVLIQRHGLGDGRCKSLEEIGRLFHVSKERIRKIEKIAMSKIRREEVQRELRHYQHL